MPNNSNFSLVLSNLQFDSIEYKDFPIRFSHYKCSDSMRANCKFTRNKNWSQIVTTFNP